MQLKSDSFNEREKAAARLVEIGRPALAAVNKASAAGDPEVAFRAKAIREALGINDAPIDLSGFANLSRDQPFGKLGDNNLASLKGGLAKFGQIPFKVGEKVAYLGSDRMPDHPRKIEGLKIGRKVSTLYMLHGMGFGLFGGVGEGVHDADKTKVEIQIVERVDIRNWWNEGGLPVTKGKLACTGENAASQRHGKSIRLYSGSWKNPHPEKEISTLDIVGKHEIALLFCVAITAVGIDEAGGGEGADEAVGGEQQEDTGRKPE